MTPGLFKLILLASVLTVTQVTVVCGLKCYDCYGDRHSCGRLKNNNNTVECEGKPNKGGIDTGEPEIDHNYAGPPPACYLSYFLIKPNETLSSSSDIRIMRACVFRLTGTDGKTPLDKLSPGCHDTSKMSPFSHESKQDFRSSGECYCATDLCNSAEFK